MIIQEITQIYPGVYKITPQEGSAFSFRVEYLHLATKAELFLDANISIEKEADLREAALVYKAEIVAMKYLSHSEHCRTGLLKKLLKKEIEKKIAFRVLDYLESVGILSDDRFAGAWIRTRSINHAEGRGRLEAELYVRGVGREATKNALDIFFSENDENEICLRALKKCVRTKKSEEKVKLSMSHKGFSQKQIKCAMKKIIGNS